MEGKRCPCCRDSKPESEFWKDSSRPDGLQIYCKLCLGKKMKPLREQQYHRYKTDPATRSKRLVQDAERRARQNSLDFDLDVEWVLGELEGCGWTCPYLGIEISLEGESWNAPSIDRVDSAKGYTKSNCVMCSWRANHLKRDATLGELQLITGTLKGLLS